MTDIQKINAEAKSAFDKGDYPLAFHTLWSVGISNFVAFAQKDIKKSNWFTHPDSAKYFWNTFVLAESKFDAFFESDSADQLLHNYFTLFRIPIPEFEIALAQEYPQVFIKAVRINQVFLRSERIDALSSIQFKEPYQLHQKVWKRIYEVEVSFWEDIQRELALVSKYSLSEILSHCVIWLETIRFTDNSPRTINHLGYVYSFFIELFFTKYPDKYHEKIPPSCFFEYFLKIVLDSPKKQESVENSNVSLLLSRISQWIRYRDHVISPYSFDFNKEPVQLNELVTFNSTPESHYKWLIDGVRYEINQLNYFFQGNDFVEELEEQGMIKIPVGKSESDIHLNRKLAASKWATILLLNDLGFTSFQIDKVRIDIETLLSPLLTYSFNRLIRYEHGLSMYSEFTHNWSEAFIKLQIDSISTKILLEPFFLMTEMEYRTLNQTSLTGLSENSTKEVLQLFSYDPLKWHEFNRFHLRYDVWQKPFMKVGGHLFCPIMFFANNSWFYSFAQTALTYQYQVDRSETKLMENNLAELIAAKGWKVKLLSDVESKVLQGDVDIFVEDEDTLLFIQLKRTYFRLNLKDTYNETVNSDSKAAKQLNKAEKFLENPNPIYQINRLPIKWIVSTSFENVGEQKDGCTKINYFEFLNALKNPQVTALKDLISYLLADKYLKEVVSNLFNDELPFQERQMIAEVINPLSVFDSKHYQQSMFSDDEDATEKYDLMFNQAVNLNEAGRKNEALKLFEDCISLNPNDGEAHSAIANILTDLGLYEKSFRAFQNALALTPNDPYVTQNYSIALMEVGRFREGLSLAIQLLEKYPLMPDLRILVEKHMEYCLLNGIIDSNEVSEIRTKWHRMN